MEEEMELEEGEAYSYNNNNNHEGNVDCIDPDVAFSYMDVKIQDVLGHFQKDFEGGVSAENLGAKFGGYGSFLPSYERSPVRLQSRSSPNPSRLEDPCRNGVVSVAAPEILSQEPVNSSTAASSQSKRRPNYSKRQEKCMPPLQTVEDENSCKSANRKSYSSIPDQKMLKVRIKLGSSENLSIQNKAAIYSGLGLDVSPSSLLDESPLGSEGMSCGPTAICFDSPTSIIQIMESCPLNGDKLLSPLLDNLIHFTQKKSFGGFKVTKLLDEKASKLVKKSNSLSGSKSNTSKKSKGEVLDVNSLTCEDLILKTLELPSISGVEGNGTSARAQSIPYRGQGHSSNLGEKASEDEQATPMPKANFLASKEKRALNSGRSTSRGKKKLKGIQNEGIQHTNPPKESLSGSSSATKSKKSIGKDILKSVSENGELKSREGPTANGRDIYKDFFGEFEHEEENQSITLIPDLGNGEYSRPVENNTNLKDRASDNSIAKLSTSEMDFDATHDVAPPTSVAPFMIQENWVCCDKCEKWRLLPVGKDPSSLPKKWLCSMLDWLPGKNCCSVSENDTNAVVSQSYHLPASQNNVTFDSTTTASAFASTIRIPEENQIISIPEAPSITRKKKDGMKQVIHQSVADEPFDSLQTRKFKQRSYEYHSDGGDANVRPNKSRNRDQSAGEDWRSPGGSSSKKPAKNGNPNERVVIVKTNSSDVLLKQQRESLENGNANIGKSVLKKRNHDLDIVELARDNYENRKGNKARASSKNDRIECSDKHESDGTIKTSRKGEKVLKPLVAPTCSPKASKNKGSLHEVKGSPDDSVSSSPMRSLKPVMVRNSVDGDEKKNNQSSKCDGEVDKRKFSHGEVLHQDNLRKKMQDEHKSAGKNDFVKNNCRNDEKSLKRAPPSRVDQIREETHAKKSKTLPPTGASPAEVPQVSMMPIAEPANVNKPSKPPETVTAVNGTRPSSDQRDSSQAAANAIKEAKDLKHMADRVKASGSNLEGVGLYFQAALKFLYGASLLELSFNASSKYSEMINSIKTYSSTAKLFEFCAHEYEKSKDMPSAALAYKCMEVAYMKVVYSSQSTATKDRLELQTALKLVPPGESPSSAVSDVDHVNNSAAVDNKATVLKDETPSRIAGNRIITPRNRPNFERLLNFAQDVNNAMEASKKSMAAFNAASSKYADSQHKEVISSIKQAIDFHFQDVEGLLQLVRVATEAISR
ncbi:hypothetical protein SAY87_027830 [Trapa incisa]|uniref:CW-type domain-containing protein n=1 Tax=Trapa incisa TaxID=236973 RepID=A0AAN7JMY6_9MYRT|nr:hypothetical protein SAY87_027830 [Trapa incisa]